MNIRKLYLVLIVLLSIGCEPDKDYYEPVDYNKLSYVLADNFNLSVFESSLRRSGLNKLLIQDGPYTVLAPSNDAFSVAGYTVEDGILTAPISIVSGLVEYHVLEGHYELDKLPFLFNQEIRTYGNGKIYVTHWVKDQDTVLTINGASVSTHNITASNGLIHVLDHVLVPQVQEDVATTIAGDERITLFSYALQRSGLEEMLKGSTTYTVFVPSNEAMKSYGFTSLHDIQEADPIALAKLVKYHIMEDRRFANDYLLTTQLSSQQILLTILLYGVIPITLPVEAEVGQQFGRMIDGNTVTITIESAGPVAFYLEEGHYAFDLIDITNSRASMIHSDIIASNGVVHIVDAVLKTEN